jgi:hypothetical protein
MFSDPTWRIRKNLNRSQTGAVERRHVAQAQHDNGRKLRHGGTLGCDNC